MEQQQARRSGTRTGLAIFLGAVLAVANFVFVETLSSFESSLSVQARLPGDWSERTCQEAVRRQLDPYAHADPTVLDLEYVDDNTVEGRIAFQYSDRPEGRVRCTFRLDHADGPPELTVTDLEILP